MTTHSTRPPNIVFLMTDQQRWDALGVVDPVVQTPNLDRLARRGVRFEQAVCQGPICVPSRYSMMLGLYPSQSGVRHNQQMCPTDGHLPAAVLPRAMADAGYETAGFGKTHWYTRSPTRPIATSPSRRGFDVYRDHADRPAGPAVAQFAREQERTGPGGQREPGYQGFTSEVPAEEHYEAWFTDQALDWLGARPDRARPFFLYLSVDAPHPGFIVPPGYEDRYRLEDIPERPLADDPAAIFDHAEATLGPIRKLKTIWRDVWASSSRSATRRSRPPWPCSVPTGTGARATT